MYTIPIIILCFVVFLVGMAAGSLVESLLRKKPPAPPAAPSTNDQLAREGDLRIFTAWRTQHNRVWLEMDDTRLDDQQTMNPGQRQRLLDLVLDLRPWLDTLNRPVTPAPVTPVRPAVNVSEVPALTPQLKTKMVAPLVEEPAPAPAMESIIQQIDRVLQARLASSAFKGRGIQLVEGPGGIVLVRDGANQYEGIDAIPDSEVKSLIQQAVAEWEQNVR